MLVTKEKVQEWIKSLRSGDFKQGKRALCENNCYCCLGVLCEVVGFAKKADDHPDRYRFNRIMYACNVDGSFTGSFTPGELIDHLFDLDDATGDLMSMNDTGGKSFSEIADFIEKNLKAEYRVGTVGTSNG